MSPEPAPEDTRFAANRDLVDDDDSDDFTPPLRRTVQNTQLRNRILPKAPLRPSTVQDQRDSGISESVSEEKIAPRTKAKISKRRSLLKRDGRQRNKPKSKGQTITGDGRIRAALETLRNKQMVNEVQNARNVEQQGSSSNQQDEREDALRRMRDRDRAVATHFTSAMDLIEECQRIRRRTNPDYRTVEDAAEERRTGRHTGCVSCRRLAFETAQGRPSANEIYDEIVSTCTHVPLGGQRPLDMVTISDAETVDPKNDDS